VCKSKMWSHWQTWHPSCSWRNTFEPEHKLAFLWFNSYETVSLRTDGKTQVQIGNPYRQDTSCEEVEVLIAASLAD
jgi:hypothetical protein